ncbi:hypothetical protein ACFQ1E_05835 [Sphingomonas canadensis]|uniref:Uncharacterized protein n=1 Tax=Sphingomonas canadensis TaxID=1219257 RepID=A0ABW3H346_9SPHN|nr:hypothetical protein [Sphingomonas canadensis]MCW3835690.1 hypothetical protein [Sphingomonas canadensis]
MLALFEMMAVHLLALAILALTRRGRAPWLAEDALLYVIGLGPALAIPFLTLSGELALGPVGVTGYMAGLLLTGVIGTGTALTVESAPSRRA